jgi:tRNA A37 threonylcarbamoyladenosine dehydratase
MHQFIKTELLIGKKGFEKLKNSKVAIFGVGGVGSFVIEGLARSGVGSFVLIDHDNIDITNINRQIHSYINNIGEAKVDVMKKRILDINPQANIDTYNTFFSKENSAGLIKKDYDYIVDAIDTVPCKIELILLAKEMGLKIISSMGAGNKLDPLKFKIADIFDTSVCPLARVIRKELKKRDVKSLKVVYSTESPIKSQGGIGVVGSVSFVPSVMGMIIAGEVIKDLV